MQGFFKVAAWIIFDFRVQVSMWLLRKAVAWMPESFSMREGIQRGIAEQVPYDRYAAYTRICGHEPMPFESWRQVFRWLRTRPAERCKVRDTSHMFVVREHGL
jgi:hypothetical protein